MIHRILCRGVLCCAAGMLVLAGSSRADEGAVENQLQRMEARLKQVEQRLTATTDQLEAAEQRVRAQEQRMTEAGLPAEGASAGGLSAFVQSIKLGGWVSGSWNYNFNGLDGSISGGAIDPEDFGLEGFDLEDLGLEGLSAGNVGAVPAYPFKGDSNSFQLDQLWFEIEREVHESQRAGFRVDLAYGKTAGLLSGLSSDDGLSGNDLELYQAYAQYLAPLGEGVLFKFGKFATPIGAEVALAPYNFNISRGHVYNLFQPITHTGLFASTEVGGVDLGFGVVNETRSFPAADIDFDNGKALLWSLGYGLGDFGLSFAGTWGQADSGAGGNLRAGNRELILDWILSWDPSDRFSAYVNVDVLRSDRPRSVIPGLGEVDADVDGEGVAVAARYQLTDSTGVALRGEYAAMDNHPFAGDLFLVSTGTGLRALLVPGDLELWGITATIDHLLGDSLLLRGELRYDSTDGDGNDNLFADGDRVLAEDDQLVGLLEVIYKFDGFAR